MKKDILIDCMDETQKEAEEFMNTEIYKNWNMYQEQYKSILSPDDINHIRQQVGSISHEIESAVSYNGRFGPLYMIFRLYMIYKRIAKNNKKIFFEL